MLNISGSPIQIFVSDIQPILPAIAGGRLRLAGIWGNVTSDFQVNYVGTYEIPGQKKTIKRLGKYATEFLVPCSTEHFTALSYLNANLPDLTLFDLAFHRFGHLSKAYITESVKHIQNADIVVFSHPWSYTVLKEYLDLDKQYLVYDSQNVEAFLRSEKLLHPLYSDKGMGLLKEIIQIEYQLVNSADLILTCSERDSEQFSFLYGIDEKKIKLTPNGVTVNNFSLAKETSNVKSKLRKKWGIKRPFCAVFSGSNFGPNIRALQFINQLASSFPEVDFIITGDMNNVISPQSLSVNVHLVGLLSQKKLEEIYRLADIGLNPMGSGSGSNVKVFTYMEAGIPVITTPLGARGVDVLQDGLYDGVEAVVLAELDEFEQQLKLLLSDKSRRERVALEAHKMILLNYDWKEISKEVCRTMKLRFQL